VPRGPGRDVGTTADDSSVLRITWIGHSTVLLELDGIRLLTDPVLRHRVVHLSRVAGEAETGALGKLDAALVSHLHHDHLDTRSLDLLSRSLPVIVPIGGGRQLRRRGFTHVAEVRVGDELRLDSLAIHVTHAEHDGRRGLFGARAPAVGYLVEGSTTAYFAGDTDLFDGMKMLSEELDLALLPVSGWGPRTPAGHLDPLRAAQALELLRPRVAVPIHWGTYRRLGLARDPVLLRSPAETFMQLAREHAPEVAVRILPVGGSLELGAGVTESGVRS
jgi:L-ascorbate metabolism protein UlaG (beta-lactamase superfamily)